MKIRTRLGKYVMLFFCALTIMACNKKEEPEKEPVAVDKGTFKWVYNGTQTVADSAVCYEDFTTIYAYRNGLLNTIEINLSDIAVGEYEVSSVMGNELKYTTYSTTHIATSGKVNISNSSFSRLSGSFNCAIASSSSQISGTFEKVIVR